MGGWRDEEEWIEEFISRQNSGSGGTARLLWCPMGCTAVPFELAIESCGEVAGHGGNDRVRVIS